MNRTCDAIYVSQSYCIDELLLLKVNCKRYIYIYIYISILGTKYDQGCNKHLEF